MYRIPYADSYAKIRTQDGVEVSGTSLSATGLGLLAIDAALTNKPLSVIRLAAVTPGVRPDYVSVSPCQQLSSSPTLSTIEQDYPLILQTLGALYNLFKAAPIILVGPGSATILNKFAERFLDPVGTPRKIISLETAAGNEQVLKSAGHSYIVHYGSAPDVTCACQMLQVLKKHVLLDVDQHFWSWWMADELPGIQPGCMDSATVHTRGFEYANMWARFSPLPCKKIEAPKDIEFIKAAASSQQMALRVVHSYNTKTPLSLLRFADGERIIISNSLNPATATTHKVQDIGWMSKMGMANCDMEKCANDLRTAMRVTDISCPILDGVTLPIFRVHDYVYPERRAGFGDFNFTYVWWETGFYCWLFNHVRVVVINRDHEVLVNKIKRVFPYADIYGIALDTWQNRGRAAAQLKSQPHSVVLGSAGPSGKLWLHEVSRYGHTVVDAGRSLLQYVTKIHPNCR